MKLLILVLIGSVVIGGSWRGARARRHPWIVVAACAFVGALYLSSAVIG